MDPLQYQMLDYSQQGSKLQVSMNSSGNVVMVPVEADSSTDDSLSQHITTHIITPEQLQQATLEMPPRYQQQQQQSQSSIYEGLELGGADENLADLQPEDSDGEDDDQTSLVDLAHEQQKLEFMAAVNLVPPAVLEEIQRRQKLCRAEYGNWWDRQHSTDFCLVPKTSSALNKVHTVVEDNSTPVYEGSDDYPLLTVDHTQVAAGPDAESMVEQITYLTSWPATSDPGPTHTVEVVTTPTSHTLQQQQQGAGIADKSYQITFQPMDDYVTH